jgi:hypothetical protein
MPVRAIEQQAVLRWVTRGLNTAMKPDDSAKPGFGPNVTSLLPDLEALYKDIHSHPELSLQETRTAGIAAGRLRAAGYEVASGIGKTGVVGVLGLAGAHAMERHVDLTFRIHQFKGGGTLRRKVTSFSGTMIIRSSVRS